MKYDIEAIFFDFGGTLFDYYPPNQVIWSRIAKRLGVNIQPDDLRIWEGMKNQEMAYLKSDKPFSKLTREGLHSLNCNVLDAMGIEESGTIDIIQEEFEDRRDGYKIFPDCIKTLEKIKSRGIKIGLLSNCDEQHGRTRRPTMRENGILHFFDAVILSSEVGFEKPQIEIFNIALKALGMKDGSKVMHVGDSRLADVVGAMNAEIIPVHYDSNNFFSDENNIRINKLSEILDYLH